MGFVFNPLVLALAFGGLYLIEQNNLFQGGICIAVAIVLSISDSISDAAVRKDETLQEMLKRLEQIRSAVGRNQAIGSSVSAMPPVLAASISRFGSAQWALLLVEGWRAFFSVIGRR